MKYIINNNDYTNEVNSLMNFAQKRFGFTDAPKVLFSDDQNNAQKTLSKTGYYDPNTSEVHIYATGRHIKDILRSMAHELVHHMQNEKGELTQGGYMGPGYAQKNPQMREMERQAYEMGNLCFRDWEDSLKEKHPTIYNERRNRTMSLKNWKNKELNENLNKKWGFKMNLNEMGMGGDPYGQMDPRESGAQLSAPHPMSPEEMEEPCMEVDPMTGECLDEPEQAPCPGSDVKAVEPAYQHGQEIPFQEANKKSMNESLSRKIRVKIKK